MEWILSFLFLRLLVWRAAFCDAQTGQELMQLQIEQRCIVVVFLLAATWTLLAESHKGHGNDRDSQFYRLVGDRLYPAQAGY